MNVTGRKTWENTFNTFNDEKKKVLKKGMNKDDLLEPEYIHCSKK